MVHVSSAGGRQCQKMLSFPSAEPSINTIDTIITVNTKEISSNSSSSSPSPSSSNTSGDPVIISSELHRELHIITEEPITTTTSNGVSTLDHNSHFDEINGKLKKGKMNQNQDGNNGNANYLADSLNSNHNMNTQIRNDGLQLISHGLTDSVCESLKLLDNENENDNSRILEQNKVFTEEIVITSKKTTKTGIMKTTTHSHVSTHGSQISKTDEWQKHYNIMEEGSINESNDSEDAPLLPFGECNSETTYFMPENNKATIGTGSTDSTNNASPAIGTPTSSGTQASHKLSKLANGTKQTGLKRVSFGSSKGSMVETLVYESPISEETEKVPKAGPLASNGTSKVITCNEDVDEAAGGSTGGSRPPSRVRVTFFESEKPLAVSSPESDIIDFDLSNMTLPPGSPNAVDHTPTYNRQMSEGWDNPFRPDGDLSKEADQIVELIKEGKPINEETLRSKSPSVNESFIVSQQNQLNASPRGKEANGTTANGGGGSGGPEVVQHGTVAPAAQASQVEHVVLKKKKGCCVIQ